MKTEEDEAFDDLAKKQGSWGGGYQAKRKMAADKLQEPVSEALSLAMDGLERILGSFEKEGKFVRSSMIRNELFTEIHLLLVQAKKALAQPVQEPIAWRWGIKKLNGGYEWRYTLYKTQPDAIPLYAAPPQREWVGLTDEDKSELAKAQHSWEDLCLAVETKLKEKNT